jgi:hypothetical protein
MRLAHSGYSVHRPGKPKPPGNPPDRPEPPEHPPVEEPPRPLQPPVPETPPPPPMQMEIIKVAVGDRHFREHANSCKIGRREVQLRGSIAATSEAWHGEMRRMRK